jgi:hypothetical protein
MYSASTPTLSRPPKALPFVAPSILPDFHKLSFLFTTTLHSVECIQQIPNPKEVTVALQLHSFPAKLVPCPPQPASYATTPSSLGGSLLSFNLGHTSSFDMKYADVVTLLSSTDRALSVMLLRTPPGTQGVGQLVGSGLLSLRGFVPSAGNTPAAHCALWNSLLRSVTLTSPTGQVVASAKLGVELTCGGPLLMSIPPSQHAEHPSFSVEVTALSFKRSRAFQGPEPSVAVQLFGFPVLLLPPPSSTATTTTKSASFTTSPANLSTSLSSPTNNVVLLLQPQSAAAIQEMPLTKSHHLLRGTSSLDLSELGPPNIANPAMHGDWGTTTQQVVITNPKGDALGTVKVKVRVFCGGRFLTAGEVKDAELPPSTKVSFARTSVSTPKLSPQMKPPSTANSPKPGSPKLKPASPKTVTPAHHPKDSNAIGGPFVKAPSPLQGSAVMKSIHFEGPFEGHGGPFLQIIEPMQGMPAPTELEGEHALGSVPFSVANTVDSADDDLNTSAFSPIGDQDASIDGVPRAAISLTLSGDVKAIAPNTAPRRAFEKHFISDVCSALSVAPANIEVLACRSGSIVVDFYLTVPSGSASKHELYIKELKKQLMDPTSTLCNGKVTHSAMKVLGEVEYFRPHLESSFANNAGDDVVRRSGTFAFATPDDSTFVVPGSNLSRPDRTRALPTASSSTLPVKVRGGRAGSGIVARNGERDAPVPLFFYPGVTDAEKLLEQERIDAEAALRRKQRAEKKSRWLEESKFDPEAERQLRESGLLNNMEADNTIKPDGGDGSTGKKEAKSRTSNKQDGRTGKKEAKSRTSNKQAGAEGFPGGSILAQMLSEVRGDGSSDAASAAAGGTSVLARMFVELLAVQRQALVRGSIDGSIVKDSMAKLREGKPKKVKKVQKEKLAKERKESKRLTVSVDGLPPPPPPAMSPTEETRLHDFFKTTAVRGTVKVSELFAFLKGSGIAFDESAITGGVKLVGDEVVDWDSILSSMAGGGTLDSVRLSQAESVGFRDDGGGEGKDENEESLVNFGTLKRDQKIEYKDDFEAS